MTDTSIYRLAVEVSEEYLGPAGERFIRRQIDTHLGVKPESLKRHQLPMLAKWTGLAFAMLTKNSSEVSSFMNGLLSLGVQKSASHDEAR